MKMKNQINNNLVKNTLLKTLCIKMIKKKRILKIPLKKNQKTIHKKIKKVPN